MRHHRLRYAPILLTLALLLAGCDFTGDTAPPSPKFEVTNDLNSRIIDLSDNSAAKSAGQADFSVSGVIRVQAPEVKGNQTVASYLSFNGNGGDRVFVGYKIPGEAYGGGIDVLNAAQPKNLNEINSIETENLDVQEVVDDPDEGAEYVAGALETNDADVSPAVVTKLTFSGNSGNNITPQSTRLSGNVAKSVVNAPSGDSQHDLYVVTDGNSLYRFNANLGSKLRQDVPGVEFSSVTAHQGLIAMLTKSGGLWTSDVASPSEPSESDLALDGTGIDPVGIARLTASTHERSGDTFVYAALNTGGFRVLDEDVDTELFRRTSGHYTSVSATEEGDYLYASRKNGTVEVYEYQQGSSPSWSATPIETINTTAFGPVSPGTQANQVLAVGDYLYVANSKGGLLVLKVNDGSRGPPGRP